MININEFPNTVIDDCLLINGDCLDALKQIPNNSIDLIIIDPPYLTTNEKWDKLEIINNELINLLYQKAKTSCSLYCWCGIGEKSQSLIRWFPIFKNNWYFKDLVTWKKQRGIGMRKGWLYTREEIMWFVKDNNKFTWNIEHQYSDEKRTIQNLGSNNKQRKSEYKRLSNIWTDIEMKGNFGSHIEFKHIKHFTPKPIKALERIINAHTNKNDLILDCFAGSFSTGVACQNTQRKFIGIELEEKYYNIGIERMTNNKENNDKTKTNK